MKTSSYVNFAPCMVLCPRIKTGISKQNNKAHVHKENWRTSVPPFLSLQIYDYYNCQTIFDLPLLEYCLQFQNPFLQIYNLINFVVNKTFDSLLEVGFENSWLLQLPPLKSTSASKNLSATSLLVPEGFIFIRALGELLIEKRRSVNKLHCLSNELLILIVFIDFCISIKK